MRPIILMMTFLLFAMPVQAGALDDIKARGVVTCAVEDKSPGFSVANGTQRNGFAVDLCSAIAAAFLGNASAVAFVSVTAADALATLQAEDADILLMARPWRPTDEIEQGVVLVLPLLENKEKAFTFGPTIRQGDDPWFISLRWLFLAMTAPNPPPAGTFEALGMKADFISRTESYGEILNRHLKTLETQGYKPPVLPNAIEWK